MKKRTTENIQPEQKMNSEQQTIDTTFRQTIANTNVGRSFSSPNKSVPYQTSRNTELYNNFNFKNLLQIQLQCQELFHKMNILETKLETTHFSSRAEAFALLGDAIQRFCHIIESEDGSLTVRRNRNYQFLSNRKMSERE